MVDSALIAEITCDSVYLERKPAESWYMTEEPLYAH